MTEEFESYLKELLQLVGENDIVQMIQMSAIKSTNQSWFQSEQDIYRNVAKLTNKYINDNF